LDISIGGVFIETDAKFPIGKELQLNLTLPNHPLPITLRGKIAWNNSKGFGLQFEDISGLHSDVLASFIDQGE
jgi:Tfp pilus assembly protein PilZ